MGDARKLSGWLPLAEFAAVAVMLAFYAANLRHSEGHNRDFLTHWTLARLAVTGHGADAYDFATQAALLRGEDIPPDRRDPLLDALHIKDIGVSPYPPVMVVLYAPFGLLPRAKAALAFNALSVALAVVSGLAIARAVNGRLRGLTCVAAAVCHPGLFVTVGLAQNAIVTLALWSVGWLLLVRRRDFAAGLVWGLLVYKVHWAVAVGWVPLVLGRPRTLAGMAVSVLALAGVATAWLGPDAWRRWHTQVSAIGDAYYGPVFRDTLLHLCDDFRGVAARYLPPELAKPVGWGAIAFVGGTTVAVYLRRRGWRYGADADTPAAPMLLFASGLIVPYLFYYDTTAFLLPLMVLWSYRDRMGPGRLALLGVLTIGYFCSQPMLLRWPILPWPTIAAVGLWGVALTVGIQD